MRKIILGTDWWTDCDDCVALRLLANAHKAGEIELIAVGINACMEYSAPSLSSFLTAEGLSDIPIGIDHKAVDFKGERHPYQEILCHYPNKSSSNEYYESAYDLYKRILMNVDDKVDVLEIGFNQVWAELLQNSETYNLIKEKVNKFYVMAGQWDRPNGEEHNFNNSFRSIYGGNVLCEKCPVPITFLGFELGEKVLTGDGLPKNDILNLTLTLYGCSETGRPSWDPMTALLAVIGDEEKAGYKRITGKATVDALTGKNNFKESTMGLHSYLIKTKPDSYYREEIQRRIQPLKKRSENIMDFKFRQVHLDFHTSPDINEIGVKFNKDEWQQTLIDAHVDSITVFSKCHHGYSFHPSNVNEQHPHLKFDLLKAQLDACAEIGVKAPVYISAGFDEKDAAAHPEWLHHDKNAGAEHYNFSNPGYHLLCLNTSYLDKLLAEIEEVMVNYNPCEIFLDIVGERVCYCAKCRADMKKLGFNYLKDEDAIEFGKIVYRNYLDKVYQIVKKHNPETAVYQNSGHLSIGRRDLVDTLEHFELESLPTGGWGYDHFPMSASYARTFRENYLGMTGKFHGTWGEFGGFKHPNALIYETSLSLAQGAGCSIGDQMHPEGKLNPSTFKLIGKAYKQVEEKEPWCKGAKNVADVGVLSVESRGYSRYSEETRADIGANRILLESKRLYNFIDDQEDFSKYKLIIMPDYIRFDSSLKEKVENYLKCGGKILLSGKSGLDNCDRFAVDVGANYVSVNEYNPTYLLPCFETVNGTTEYVLRSEFNRFENIDADVYAYAQNPYFNRTAVHFCSHQHAPNNRADTYPAAIIKGNVAYIGWNAFKAYADFGDYHIKELLTHSIEMLLADDSAITVENLPDRGVVTLTEQGDRKIIHLLFAHTTKRGLDTEVIEDIVPVFNIEVTLKVNKPKRVVLVPQNVDIEFLYENGKLKFTVPELYIHQMISIE